MSRRILQLGAGEQRLRASADDVITRVDLRANTQPDVVWDLNAFPYPFQDDAFDVIDCSDVLEHLGDLVRVMEEIHRVGRAGAAVHITTPHFSSANSYTDPTHVHHLGLFSFDYFTGDNQWSFYTGRRYRKRRAELVFQPTFLNKLVWRVARRWPRYYEERLTWIFPAWFMSFELEVLK